MAPPRRLLRPLRAALLLAALALALAPAAAGSVSLPPQLSSAAASTLNTVSRSSPSQGRALATATARRKSDDDDDGGGLGLGLGLGPLGALGGAGSMSPMTLLPALLPLGMLPTSLAQLAAAVLAASTLGQFALGRALMQLVRDLVFGPRPGPLVVYKNKGWEQRRPGHGGHASAPPPHALPPEVQMLLNAAAHSHPPVPPKLLPHPHPPIKLVPSREVPVPPFLLHEVHKKPLVLPPGLKLLPHTHTKLLPIFKHPASASKLPLPLHHVHHHHEPPPAALRPQESSGAKIPSGETFPEHAAPEHAAPGNFQHPDFAELSTPVYAEFPTHHHPGQLKLLGEASRPKFPYALDTAKEPAPVSEEPMESRKHRPAVTVPKHHAELLRLPHPHPAVLPAAPPPPPTGPDHHLHVHQFVNRRLKMNS